MTEEPIRADPAAIARVRDSLSRSGVRVTELPEPVRAVVARITEGAGEFAPDLGSDATGFELSWSVSLETMSTSLGNLAANVGGFGIDLVAVDLEAG